jgi:hypothetical protein
VRATATGYAAAEQRVTLKDGEVQSVSLSLQVDPTYRPLSPAPTQEVVTPLPAPPPPAAGAPHASHAPAFVAFGIGAAGLVVGSVFGVFALSTKSSLDSACPSKVSCPPSSQSDIDALHTQALVSTIGFGVGIAGAAVGAVLLATAKTETTGRTAVPSPRIAVAPWVGPTSLGLAGVFQ